MGWKVGVVKQAVKQAVALNCGHIACLMNSNLNTIEFRGLSWPGFFFLIYNNFSDSWIVLSCLLSAFRQLSDCEIYKFTKKKDNFFKSFHNR